MGPSRLQTARHQRVPGQRLDDLDVGPEGAHDEVVLGGPAPGKVAGQGTLLEHVRDLREPVDVLADVLVVLVPGLWQ